VRVPQLSQDSVAIFDGKIVLTQRKRSSAWQARFRVGDRWLRITTKQTELEKAKATALDMYARAKFRNEEGLPVVSKRFSQVAALAKAKMQEALDNGEGKSVYKDYIIAINNYLDPFFGKYNITSIDYALMTEFSAWRKAKLGHEVKTSSLNTHNSALNRIFDEAMERGYMTKSQVPLLKNKGAKSERRPDLTVDEYRQLIRFMPNWIKQGKDGKSRSMRDLLRDYVLILANTGMRHGTESYGLKWKHISFFEEKVMQEKAGEAGKKEYVTRRFLMMTVNGKTGPRELVARHSVVSYLKRIHSRTDDIKDMDFEELIKKGVDKEVFRLPNGVKTENLNQTFEILMKDAGLLIDRRTEQKRTLYSLRHTYATMALVKARMDIHTLATQMGTSVVMIEKHYSHLTPRMRASAIAGFNHLERTENKKE
jgi:integrase